MLTTLNHFSAMCLEVVSRVSCSITFPETKVRLTKPAIPWIILHTFLGEMSGTCSLLVLNNLSQSLTPFKDYWEWSHRVSASSLSSCVFNLSIPNGLKYAQFVLELLGLVLLHWWYVLIQIFLVVSRAWGSLILLIKTDMKKVVPQCHLCPYPPGPLPCSVCGLNGLAELKSEDLGLR